jgi:hypothetical protein
MACGIGWPRLSTLYYITVHPFRGLFVQSPVLLLAFAGFAFMWKIPRWRVECALAAFSLLTFLLVNSSLTLWYGGSTFGPRYLIPMLPFLSLPLSFLPRRWLPLMSALTVISIANMFIATAGNPLVPGFEFRKLLDQGATWISYFGYSSIYGESLRVLMRGEYARNLGMLVGLRGLSSLVPLGLFLLFVTREFYKPRLLPDVTS